jgi:hypothetical protein
MVSSAEALNWLNDVFLSSQYNHHKQRIETIKVKKGATIFTVTGPISLMKQNSERAFMNHMLIHNWISEP